MSEQIKKDTIYSKLFARTYDPIMNIMGEKGLQKKRKQLLSNLNGKILEVGAGTGVNFPLFPKDAAILACEPSLAMFKKAQAKLEHSNYTAQIKLIHAGLGSPELESHIPEEGFDGIVCTLVLCTIPNATLAMSQMIDWLKPGGKLFIMEHIHAKSGFKRHFMDLINPTWRFFSEGCNLNRDTDQLIKSYPLIIEQEKYFGRGVPFYMAILQKQ